MMNKLDYLLLILILMLVPIALYVFWINAYKSI